MKLPQKCVKPENSTTYTSDTGILYIIKIKENSSKLTKERSRRHPAKTITDADYADDIALLANAPTQDETLLHSLERAAAGICLYVDAHKTEYFSLNKTGDISTLNKFTYQGSSVSSTEIDINNKCMTAIERLSVVWKSELADKMKCSLLQNSGRVHTAIWKNQMDAK